MPADNPGVDRDADEANREPVDERRRDFLKYAAAGSAAALGGVGAVGSAAAEDVQLDRSNWTASASSTQDPPLGQSGPSATIDGNVATYWQCGSSEPGEWLQIDMGAATSFYKIEFKMTRSQTDDNPLLNSWPDEYEIQVRSDASEAWQTVATGTGNSHSESVTFPSQTERYVRIVSTSNDGWSVAEVYAYSGSAAGGGPTPGAPSRPAATYEGPPTDPETGMPRYGRWTHTLIGAGGKTTGVYTTPANENVVYQRNDVSGTYRSDDAGDFWYQIHNGDAARGVSVDPRDEDDVVLVQRDGIHHSSRAGENYQNASVSNDDVWTHAVERETAFAHPNGTYRSQGNVVARDPTNPDRLIAGAIAGGNGVPCLYRSTDGGETWENLPNSPSGIQTVDVIFSPTTPGTVLIASRADDRSSGRTYDAGLWRSTDGGDTWSQIQPAGSEPIEMEYDPDAGDLYGYFGSGKYGTSVARSTDDGETWTTVNDGLPTGSNSSAAFSSLSARSGEIFLFGDDGGSSTNSAVTWRLPSGESTWELYYDGDPAAVDDSNWWKTGAPGISEVAAVAFDELDPDRWYMSATYAMYRSTDAGKSWTYQSKGIEEMVGMSVVADPDPDSDIVHAGIADLQFFRLREDGRELDFHRVPDLMMNQRVTVSPDDPSRVYVGSANYATFDPVMGKICISHDRGDSWARAGVTYDNDDAEGTGEVEGSGADGEPTGLPADQAPWWDVAFAGPPPTRCPVGLSANPTDADHVVAGLATDSVAYESTDGGKTWTQIPGTLQGNGDTPGSFWQIFFAKGNQLAVSGDGSLVAAPKVKGPAQYYDREAAQWKTADIPFGDEKGNPWHVEHDHNTPGRFLVSFIDQDGGLYETRDGGETWEKLLPDRTYAVAVDQQHPERIAVASVDEEQILLTLDSGDSWVGLEQLPSLGYGDNMTFSGERLVVGVGGSSYYTTDISDILDSSPPPAPPNLHSTGHTSTTVDLAWDAVTDPETSVAHYNVYVDGSKQIEARDTTATVSGLDSSTAYDFRVTAVDAGGNESGASSTVTVTTDSGSDTVAPTAPTSLRSPKQTRHTVHLNWDASTDRESSVDHYNVYLDGSRRTESTSTRTVVHGLEADTTYRFSVTAVDAAGNESGHSNEITVETEKPPERGDDDGTDEDGDGYDEQQEGDDAEAAEREAKEARDSRGEE